MEEAAGPPDGWLSPQESLLSDASLKYQVVSPELLTPGILHPGFFPQALPHSVC